MTDEIVDEIHAVRKRIWEECGGDFKKLVEQLIQCQEQQPERLVHEVPATDEFADLASAAQSSLAFWDNPTDDRDWNNAAPG
jgi:hypothetical protein